MEAAVARGAQMALLICDVQTRFRPIISRMDTVVAKCALLNDVCKLLVLACFDSNIAFLVMHYLCHTGHSSDCD
jgi:hypothetical protein